MRASDMERVSAVAFRRWCAEELIDPRLEDILEEAFIAGFIAREFVEPDPASRSGAENLPEKEGSSGSPIHSTPEPGARTER